MVDQLDVLEMVVTRLQAGYQTLNPGKVLLFEADGQTYLPHDLAITAISQAGYTDWNAYLNKVDDPEEDIGSLSVNRTPPGNDVWVTFMASEISHPLRQFNVKIPDIVGENSRYFLASSWRFWASYPLDFVLRKIDDIIIRND
jgi:hypothetical protein